MITSAPGYAPPVPESVRDAPALPATTPGPIALDAVRAFGVTCGGPLLLNLFAATSVVAMARGYPREPRTGAGRLARAAFAFGALLPAAYALAIRPWHQRWGASEEELHKPLPGDDMQPNPGIESTRALTIDAPIEAVWPWLAQIGQERGGFYSYACLENLAGCRLKNADAINPEWQQREVGEPIYLHPALALKVTAFEPQRAFGIEGWGTYVLEPLEGNRTRLLARARTPRGLTALYYLLLIEIPHFIMERKMLLGIKERAERQHSREGASGSPATTYSISGR